MKVGYEILYMRLDPHPRTRIDYLLGWIMFSPLRIVALGLPADPLHLLDLPSLAGRLNVLEVHLKPSRWINVKQTFAVSDQRRQFQIHIWKRNSKNGRNFDNFLRNFKTTSHVVNNMHRYRSTHRGYGLRDRKGRQSFSLYWLAQVLIRDLIKKSCRFPNSRLLQFWAV